MAGKTALITGAANGIGLALAERCLRETMSVVMVDIEENALARESARLRETGGAVEAFVGDVADPSAVDEAAEVAVTEFGGIHLLCNNAGVAPGGSLLDTTASEWRWAIDVNVLGVANGIRAVAPRLVGQGEGHIVNVASEAGLVSREGLGLYSATEHAVVGLSEVLHHELVPHGVGVSCVCPALVRTQLFRSERNSPARVEFPDDHGATMAPLREIAETAGIDPAAVADAAIEATRENRFWVFTHPETIARVERRFRGVANEQNPDLGI